jgi:ATP-binding cassette subfamily F protein uup
MNLISAQGLCKTLGEKRLIEGATFGIEAGERIGVIGVNGCGKSTLLKILAGLEPPDAGTLARRQGLRVALLSQNPDGDPSRSILEHVFAPDAARGADQADVLRRWETSQARLARHPDDPALTAEIGRLASLMDSLGAWDFEARARATLGRLGLGDLERPIGELSGGERRRVDLGRALLAEPDLLLLDEPTNHMDADLIEWLEGWLTGFGGAVVMVTHDRYFLNRVARKTWEIDRATLRLFDGNFAYYVEKKAEIEADFAKKEDRRLNQLRRELEWLRRGAKARSTKQRARIERAEALAEADFARRSERLELATGARRMGKKVVELKGIEAGYPGAEPVVRGLDCVLVPGQRLGIVGPNGCGKTTLANLLAGRHQPTAGSITIGLTVAMAYLDQESAGFDLDERVIDDVKREGGAGLRMADGRVLPAEMFLAQFNFTPQMQCAPIGKLSGGERRRLDLVRTLLRDPNFLILDEPTNDLDIAMLEALEEFLDGFAGCVLAISHDRYFLDRIVDRVLAPVGGGEWRIYPGGYSYYAEARRQEEARHREAQKQAADKERQRAVHQAVSTDAVFSIRHKSFGFNEKRELARLEDAIPRMEERLRALQASMAEASADYERLHRLSTEQADLSAALETAMDRWGELTELAD